MPISQIIAVTGTFLFVYLFLGVVTFALIYVLVRHATAATAAELEAKTTSSRISFKTLSKSVK